MTDSSHDCAQRPWRDRPVVDRVRAIPHMLSDEEVAYLGWVTAVAWRGEGAVVDLGPWLGGSSAALAAGMQEAGRPGRVLAYDLFERRSHYMVERVPQGRALADGASFLPLFEELTAPFAERIEARPGSLHDAAWDEGPIEILFVDAAKDWKLTRSILRVFGPALIPGVSRVICQDFRFHECPWLPLVFDGNGDVWREIESVADGTTVTFVPTRVIDPAALRMRDEDFPLADVVRILGDRIDREIDPVHRLRYAQSLARLGLQRAAVDAASAALRARCDLATCERAETDVARAWLRTRLRELAFEESGPPAADALPIAERAAAMARDPQLAAVVLGVLDPARELPPQLGLEHGCVLTAAAALLRLGRVEAAARATRMVLEHPGSALPASDARWAFELLESAWAAQPPADPRGTLGALAARHGHHASYHVLCGLVHRALGDRDAADAAFARAATIDPDHPRRAALGSG